MKTLRGVESRMRKLLEEVRGLEAPGDLAERFGRYRDDPAGFVEHELGAEPEPYQVEILEACVTSPRVAWRAAHGVGKTAVLAWILLWWLLTRPFSRVLVLAPAFERQIGRTLLPEVRKWARGAAERLPVTMGALTVDVDGHERDWFAIGVPAADTDKIEGAHRESLAVLADEAKGLDADVVAGLHGTQTDPGGDRLYFLASVPGGPSGAFYDTFRKGAGLWSLFHTSARESSLVSELWIAERREEWGEGSPLFQARVEGEFPEEDEGTLLRLSDLEAAVERELEPKDLRPIRLGVDVARFGGDASAIATWRGRRLESVVLRRGLDTMDVASWVASTLNRLSAATAAVDVIGMGSGVVDRLAQLGLGKRVRAENVGAGAKRSDLFLNRRAECFWRFREAVEKGEVSLPGDPELLAELASFRYVYTAAGKIQLEAKEETRKRVGRSPDRADAAVIGFALGLLDQGRRRSRFGKSESYLSLGGGQMIRAPLRMPSTEREAVQRSLHEEGPPDGSVVWGS